MDKFTILYRDSDSLPLDSPKARTIEAISSEIAEESFLLEFPTADVVWISTSSSTQQALNEYWGTSIQDS